MTRIYSNSTIRIDGLDPVRRNSKGNITILDISNRNKEIGLRAMHSSIGVSKFCKSVILHSITTVKQPNSSPIYRTNMNLFFQMNDFIEEAIGDAQNIQALIDDSRREQDYEIMREVVYRDIAEVSRWLRNKTTHFIGHIRQVEDFNVAPDFTRGILIIRDFT